MKIRVLFFGATAAAAGKRKIDAVVDGGACPADVLTQLSTQLPGLRSRKLLFAVNEKYVDGHVQLNDGDELAIFSPVSGG
jgi:molybdopterin converting factor small subunit